MLLDDILSELTSAQRSMVELRIEGHEIGIISERTERSKRTVERVLRQFRERLTRLIDDRATRDETVEYSSRA